MDTITPGDDAGKRRASDPLEADGMSRHTDRPAPPGN